MRKSLTYQNLCGCSLENFLSMFIRATSREGKVRNSFGICLIAFEENICGGLNLILNNSIKRVKFILNLFCSKLSDWNVHMEFI